MRKLLIVCFCLFVISASVHAQSSTAEPDQKWWWAWRESSGEVIAFNDDGETHVIAHTTSASRFSRVSTDTAFAILDIGDSFALYKLTPQAAVRIGESMKGPFDPMNDGLSTYQLVEIKWPNVVLTGSIDNRLWVINLETNSVERTDQPLNTKCDSTGPTMYCVRFSQDGRYLRYTAEAPAQVSDVGIALRERDLVNGSERTFYVEHGFPDANFTGSSCKAGAYGEHWLCHAEVEFEHYEVDSYRLIDLAGRSQTLIEQSLYGISRWNIFLSDDALVILDGKCERHCTIDVYASDGQFQHSYDLPDDGPHPGDIYLVMPIADYDLLLYTNFSGIY